MKKWDINPDFVWSSPYHLEYTEEKKGWKCETTIGYLYKEERIYGYVTFFYDKNGKKTRTKFHEKEYKEQMKYVVKIDKEIQRSIDSHSVLIHSLQQLLNEKTSITGFKEFSYDFEQKQGEFTFEGYPLDFFFVFQPLVGIKVIYIDYYPEDSRCNARIKDDPKEVLGEEFTEMLNGWIKEKLKTRFFF